MQIWIFHYGHFLRFFVSSYLTAISHTPKNNLFNFLGEAEILKEVITRFSTKAGDKPRILTNTVASQTCCFNLFAPLKNRLNLSSNLFQILLNKDNLKVTSIEIEFTPKKDLDYDETIGDQSPIGGTDADVAVFYDYDENKKGILLVEFKYIESEFSFCSSYRTKNGKEKKGVLTKNIRPQCDDKAFYRVLIEPNLDLTQNNFDCGGQGVVFQGFYKYI